jgi:GMP synthase (glutamine-hydrolysing)
MLAALTAPGTIVPVRTIRVLLLQARVPGDPMKEHELRCFATRLGVPISRLLAHDLLEGPPPLRTVREHDALVIGGSGDYYVSRGDLPHLERTLDLLREVVEIGHPTFGSCFGYHLLVRALGGVVIHDPALSEVGTFELVLTEAGRADPLFSTLPVRFEAQLGHKDRATSHPEGIPNLASSERSPFQALRVPGKPIWATQFHPELDHEASTDRYRTYLAAYGGGRTDADDAFLRFRPTPDASDLLHRFVRLVLA